MLWRRNSALRLLLKGMDHPDIVCDLQRVDDAKRIAPFANCQFPDALTEPGEWLRNLWRAAFSDCSKRIGRFVLHRWRELAEILQRRLDPGYVPLGPTLHDLVCSQI